MPIALAIGFPLQWFYWLSYPFGWLLNHTALPILDVALRSGFGEISHFHRSFRERFKMTPLKYRKQCEAAR